jgi:putative transposase
MRFYFFTTKNRSTKDAATVNKIGNYSELFQLIDRKKFDALVDKWSMDKSIRSFSTWEMTCALVSSMALQLGSYRDIEMVLRIPRSTLSDALNQRCHGFFQELSEEILINIKARTKDRKIKRAIRQILALDSTECRVHGSLFATPNWKPKNSKTDAHSASIKLHVVWDIAGEWIEDFRISPARRNDTPVSRTFDIQKNKVYVFDRAYDAIDLWIKIIEKGAHFVSRLKHCHMTLSQRQRVLPENAGVLLDITYCPSQPTLNRLSEEQRHKARFRHIVFRDAQTKKIFDFITSDFATPAETIAEIYKQRWAIELLFRWLKGHLNIRYLPAKKPNSVKTQLAIAVLLQLLLQLKRITTKYSGTLWELLRNIRTSLQRKGLAGIEAPPGCRWKSFIQEDLRQAPV